jgi:hypothetical protein
MIALISVVFLTFAVGLISSCFLTEEKASVVRSTCVTVLAITATWISILAQIKH